MPVQRDGPSVYSVAVVNAAAVVLPGIGVEKFPPESFGRDASAIIRAGSSAEVADNKNCVGWRRAVAEERDHVFFRAVCIEPAKTLRSVFRAVKRRFLPIQTI